MDGIEIQVNTILTSELDGLSSLAHAPATLAPNTCWIGDG
jgi:hypothetical protein